MDITHIIIHIGGIEILPIYHTQAENQQQTEKLPEIHIIHIFNNEYSIINNVANRWKSLTSNSNRVKSKKPKDYNFFYEEKDNASAKKTAKHYNKLGKESNFPLGKPKYRNKYKAVGNKVFVSKKMVKVK